MSSNLDRETAEWASHQEPTHSYATPGSTTGPDISTPSIATVFETVLDLRSQELAVYDAIAAEPGASTKALASTLDRDRSNVNRSLTKLESAGLVTRHRRILDSGGYYYANHAAPSDVVDDIVSTAVEQWAGDAQSMLTDQQWETPLAGSSD